MSEIEGWSSTW